MSERYFFVSVVIQEKPPWYWRMVGREYWRGWRIQVTGFDRRQNISFQHTTEPESHPPNPDDVASATSEGIAFVMHRLLCEGAVSDRPDDLSELPEELFNYG